MSWIRDPRPGIAWRTKRLRNNAKRRIKRERQHLPEPLSGMSYRDRGTRFRVKWSRYWYDHPVDDRLVVYESFGGNGALCSPRAIFDELLKTPDMSQLRHVWCFNNLTVKRQFDKQYATHPRVRSVLTGTIEYYRVLSTAKYLVNNQTFPPSFVKREEQVYLNTWHGPPLKTMGYNSPEGPYPIRNTVRNFLTADYLLSANPYMTEALYAQGYRLRGIYRGTVIEEGYPRIDAQFLDEAARAGVRTELRSHGLAPDGTKLVLYTPTWRGRSFFDPIVDVGTLRADIETLAEELGPEYTVLLKVHQQIYKRVVAHDELAHRLVPNTLPTNRLLACVDVLVTDYSSVFFDFLASGRPVLFYIPDARTYERDRGILFERSELPGPTYEAPTALAAGIRAIKTGAADDPLETHGDRYHAAAAKYCPAEDGRATSRIIDVVFRGNRAGYRMHSGLLDNRTSILIWAGHARTSGVITSLFSLLQNIDPARHDVTLLTHPPRNGIEKDLQTRIPNSVRHIIRTGTFPATARRLEIHNRFMDNGLDTAGNFPSDTSRMLAAEWRHCVGLSKFDHAIEFSGYTPFWAAVILQGKADTRSIWMHNDLLAESQRGTNDKRFKHEGLPATFTLYRWFDNLVSVSETLARINADSLRHLAAPEKFRFARNTIDADRIRSMAGGDATARGASDAPPITVANVSLAQVARQFVNSYPLDLVADEVERQTHLARLMPDRHTVTTFVTVGRLSPEKNHARLLRAFARVHAEDPTTRLLILGDGPLMSDLESLTGRLGISDAVRLAGHQTNPYALMAEADCFVLSSDYEGQPMVILEALALGLPVVTVEFASAASALPNGDGLVVPQSVDDLAAGMRTFLRGEVSAGNFDVTEYNSTAVDEFVGAIHGAGSRAAPTTAG